MKNVDMLRGTLKQGTFMQVVLLCRNVGENKKMLNAEGEELYFWELAAQKR